MSHSRRRQGFATIVAVFLIGLVTAAVATMVADRMADARRTRATTTDAQLRQLLLAATADAAARVTDATAPRWRLDLPADAAGFGVEVRVTAGAADRLGMTATAIGGGRRLAEQVRFARTAAGWETVSVTLDGD